MCLEESVYSDKLREVKIGILLFIIAKDHANSSAISWLGEFCYDRAGSQSLHGHVKYSPDQGIILHFFKPIVSPWSPPGFLRGILETGEECALISPINLPGIERIQYTSYKDGPTVVRGEIGYQFLVLGKHAGLEELVNEVSFSFSGLASFAAGKDRHCQFERGPMIYSKQTPPLPGKLTPLQNDHSNQGA